MNETKICANCGAEYPIDEMFQVENAVEDDTHTLCDHCFDEYYVRCEDCNRIIHRDRAYGTVTTTPIAYPTGMSIATLFTSTITHRILFSTARACGISALSLKSTTAVQSTATRRSC